MKVLVTGATGLVGKALCRILSDAGCEINVLSRRAEGTQVVHGARAFRWNPEAELPPAEAWEGVESVIHLAGEPIAASRWTQEQKKRIRDSRVEGTRNLVKGMSRLATAPKTFVSSSAVGYYGDRGDEPVDERSQAGRGFLSDVCVEWEREAAAARDLGMRVAMVRIGVVLAQGGGALEKMLVPFKLGLGGRLGDGRQWFPWIHLDDIVGVIRHALLNPLVAGPINGVAPGIVNNAEFTKDLAAALHRPTFLPVPKAALMILMGEMADVVLTSLRVIPRVALETGYQFKYPELRPALESLFV
jgi:uncharacterized protein (TIGR01777 family)